MQILPKLNFQLKSAYLIIHVAQNKALQTPTLKSFKQLSPQFSAVNERNHKELWIIDQRQPGLVELVNGFTDKVLTAQQNGKLTIRKGKGDRSQYWVLSQSNGMVRINNAKYRQLYLSFDKIRKSPALKKNSSDTWQFRKVTQNQQLNQTCFIFDPRQQKMIDVPQSTLAQQQTICVWKPNYRFNQRWRLYKAGQVYIIKSYLSRLNLDVNEENFDVNQKIIQYHSTGGVNQMWMLERFDNSTNDEYRIYCFAEPQYELGHNGKRLQLYKGKKFVWKIQGFIPE